MNISYPWIPKAYNDSIAMWRNSSILTARLYIPGAGPIGMQLAEQLKLALDILGPHMQPGVQYDSILDHCCQDDWCFFTDIKAGEWYIGNTTAGMSQGINDDLTAYRHVERRADEGSQFHRAALAALAALNITR